MLTITTKEFKQLAEFIKKHYGIYLREEKKVFIIGRLHTVLAEMGFSNFSQYYNYLMEDSTGESLRILVDRITTNHTYFMREPDQFIFFKEQVLPYLKYNNTNRDLRVWCGACSTGEEAYTLAMIIDEFFEEEKKYWDTSILATDLSTKVLEIAKQGIYSAESVKNLPKRWIHNYMKKYMLNSYIFHNEIKRQIIFRRFNLMQEVYPFKKKLDVIFLRNVMIYFDNNTKEELIEKMYYHLNDGGYLFIGQSESINKSKTKLKYIQPAVYRKI